MRLARTAPVRGDAPEGSPREDHPCPPPAPEGLAAPVAEGPTSVGATSVGGRVEEDEGPLVIERAPPRAAVPARAGEWAPDLRQRVREALSCPYCRDEVTRSAESVTCAREACGALYHSECWDELTVGHGTCAVFGCGCDRSRPVSSAGYVWRVARLFAAALLVPRRLAEEAAEREGESIGAQVRRICELAYPSLDAGDEYGLTKLCVYVGGSVGLAALCARLLPALFPGHEVVATLLIPLVVLVLTMLIPTLVAAGGLALLVLGRALLLALRGELTALERGQDWVTRPKIARK